MAEMGGGSIGAADTSSYPKPAAPVSLLDNVQKFGNLQAQSLNINQAKLDQANQGLTYMTRAMGALGPNATKDQYISAAATAVKMGLVPADQLNVFVERAKASPTSQDFYNEFMTTAADHQQQINYHLGQRVDVANGQQTTPSVASVKPGFGVRPIAMPVQQQAPPGAVVMDKNNQPTTVGAQSPQLAPGTAAGPVPIRSSLPVERPIGLPAGPIASSAVPGQSANFGGNVVAANVEPATNGATGTPISAAPQPKGYSAGPPPMFEEGKKQIMEDQANATAKMTAVKPAMLALKILPGLQTGPGTETWNKAVAFLKAQGVIPAGKEDDKTVVYQEANKYLSQYLKGRGGRSDADLAMAEKSSPNVGVQLNPALQNLTRSAIAQDRIEAARPTAFTGTDYQNYGKHRATFPQSVDERAFQLDLMPKEQSTKLVDDMHTRAFKNGANKDGTPKNPPADALKFFKSLDIAKKQGFFNSEQE